MGMLKYSNHVSRSGSARHRHDATLNIQTMLPEAAAHDKDMMQFKPCFQKSFCML
jgi:hypothetical protein